MSEELTFVCWKYSVTGFNRVFESSFVNIWANMIDRHHHAPHRFVCITDDPKGLDKRIEAIPQPVTFEGIGSPHGAKHPSCFRRLWNFSADAAKVLGPCIVQMDIDLFIVDDITETFQRDEDLVLWADPRFSWARVGGGIYLLRTGTNTDIWDRFVADPHGCIRLAHESGCRGSDQAWLSYCRFPPEKPFTTADGMYSLKWLKQGKPLPKGPKIIQTPGSRKPWHSATQEAWPFVKDHWK
jgi:hypothetical protein